MKRKNDFIGNIIAYESGELSEENILKLFSKLIKSGQCWALQGHYGRIASDFIEKGFIDKKGKINWELYKSLV